jgi:hypothetical protein
MNNIDHLLNANQEKHNVPKGRKVRDITVC